MRQKSGIRKTGGLLAIDCFLEITVQEGVFDVQLIDSPPLRNGK
jgi:hypothetical protein